MGAIPRVSEVTLTSHSNRCVDLLNATEEVAKALRHECRVIEGTAQGHGVAVIPSFATVRK